MPALGIALTSVFTRVTQTSLQPSGVRLIFVHINHIFHLLQVTKYTVISGQLKVNTLWNSWSMRELLRTMVRLFSFYKKEVVMSNHLLSETSTSQNNHST